MSPTTLHINDDLTSFQREVRSTIEAYVKELFKQEGINSTTVENFLQSKDDSHGVKDSKIELSLEERRQKNITAEDAAFELKLAQDIATSQRDGYFFNSKEARKAREIQKKREDERSKDKEGNRLIPRPSVNFSQHHNTHIIALYTLLRYQALGVPEHFRTHNNNARDNTKAQQADIDIADAALHIIKAVTEANTPTSLQYFARAHHAELFELVKNYPDVVAEHFIEHLAPEMLQPGKARHTHMTTSNQTSLRDAIQSAQNYEELKSSALKWYEAALAGRQTPSPVIGHTFDRIGGHNVRASRIP